MKLPILDLKEQYKNIKKEIDSALQNVLDSQAFILGDEVTRFEEEMARQCGVAYAVGVSSGTDALTLSLRSLGISQGAEVITTPFTFIATGESIVQVGAKPVFVDIDPRTYNIDPGLVERSVTPATKALIPVHLYGQCADMDPLCDIARRRKIAVVEDCAQAIKAEYKKRKAGTGGVISAFSFFPSKNLGAYGDAGMVLTNDRGLFESVRSLRVHGSVSRYVHSVIGYNSRLDNLQAAILRVKLAHLDEWLKARQKNARYYNESLQGLPLVTPFVPSYNTHTYHLYVLRATKGAQGLMKYLTEHGIENRTYYPVPLHLQDCFRYLGYKKGDFPEAEKAALETLAIPLYPELTKEQMDYVVGVIKRFYGA